jgi:hypothetical protein
VLYCSDTSPKWLNSPVGTPYSVTVDWNQFAFITIKQCGGKFNCNLHNKLLSTLVGLNQLAQTVMIPTFIKEMPVSILDRNTTILKDFVVDISSTMQIPGQYLKLGH